MLLLWPRGAAPVPCHTGVVSGLFAELWLVLGSQRAEHPLLPRSSFTAVLAKLNGRVQSGQTTLGTRRVAIRVPPVGLLPSSSSAVRGGCKRGTQAEALAGFQRI